MDPRARPSSEAAPASSEVEWLGPPYAPWTVARLLPSQPPLTNGFPLQVLSVRAGSGLAPGDVVTAFPLLARPDAALFLERAAATLTSRPLARDTSGYTKAAEYQTTRGILTLLLPTFSGYLPSLVDVQALHAEARAAGGGVVRLEAFPFTLRDEPVQAHEAGLGEYALAAAGGFVFGVIVGRVW